MNKRERREAWLKAGMPDDIDELEKLGITFKDVKAIEKRVMRVVAEKMLQREDVTTFGEHRTIQ